MVELIHAFRVYIVINNFDEYILLNPQQQAVWIMVLGYEYTLMESSF